MNYCIEGIIVYARIDIWYTFIDYNNSFSLLYSSLILPAIPLALLRRLFRHSQPHLPPPPQCLNNVSRWDLKKTTITSIHLVSSLLRSSNFFGKSQPLNSFCPSINAGMTVIILGVASALQAIEVYFLLPL